MRATTIAASALLVLGTSGCAGLKSFFGVGPTTPVTSVATPKRAPIQVTIGCTTPPYTKAECEGVRTTLVQAGYNVTATPATTPAPPIARR